TLTQTWPHGLDLFVGAFPGFLGRNVDIRGLIRRALPEYRGEILFSQHHLSHAAGAFYCSPFDSAAILVVDGVGESATATLGVGRGNEVELLRNVRFPHSLGLFYSAMTEYLGFQVNEGESKVMGLA